MKINLLYKLAIVTALSLSPLFYLKKGVGDESSDSNLLQPESRIHAIGYIEPRGELRRLAFRGHGVIESIESTVGDTVKSGAVLARLNDEVEQSDLAIAKSKLALAQANRGVVLAGAHPDAINGARELLKLAEAENAHRQNEYERVSSLGDRRSISDVELKLARFDARAAAARVGAAAAALARLENQIRDVDRVTADAEVAAAEAAVLSAEAALERRVLRAPCDGTILELFRREGEAISLSYGEPVVLLAPSGPFEVRAEVDEAFVLEVKKGDRAAISSSFTDSVISGKIRSIKPVMGRKTVFSREATERLDLQIIEVRIELEEPSPWPVGYEVDVVIGPAS